MKEEILKCISKGGVSFVELSREVPGFNGEYQWSNDSNWVYWSGMSEEACKALKELKDQNIIDAKPCNPIIYMVDGGYMSIPLVKSNRKYKKPHWIPMTWSLVK